MNSSAYVGMLEFIFEKSAQASRILKIGLPVICYSYKLSCKYKKIMFCALRTICRQSERALIEHPFVLIKKSKKFFNLMQPFGVLKSIIYERKNNPINLTRRKKL